MKRREFITLLGGTAVAWPLAARTQQPERTRRIGVLMPESEGDPDSQARVVMFHRTLQELGWTVGRNLRIDYRWAMGDPESTRVDAAELLRLAPDVILAVSSPALATVQKATRTIPVVFVAVSEPVAQGFVQSLAHPGGNITGFTNLEPTFGGKWLELLKEIAPRVTRVAIMFNPNTAPYAALFSRSVEAAAQKFAAELVGATVHQLADVEAVMSMLASEPGGGLIVLPDPFTTAQGKLIGGLAARFQLPAIYPFRFMLTDGGLASYGVNVPELFRQAARRHIPGRQARRPAGAAADQVRAGDQPQDRQGARLDGAAVAACPR